MPRFASYSPRHRVLIKDLKTGDTKYDISDDLVSLSTNKAYGRAAGTWQMMLTFRIIKDGKRYHELIQPNDVITIELDAGDGSGMKPVMLGLADRAAAHRTIDAQGRPIRQVKVSGQDMGKLLMNHDIGWDLRKEELVLTKQPDDQGGPPKQKTMKDVSRKYDPSLQTGRAEVMIGNLFNKTFDAVLDSAKRYFLTSFKTDDDWVINEPNMLNLRGVKLWEAMKRAEHAPYNVLTTDTDTDKPDKFWITLEQYPVKDTGKLARSGARLHTIEDAEIIGDDVGVGDGERINFLFYDVNTNQLLVDMQVDVLMVHPDLIAYDENSIKLHGYCQRTFRDSFVPASMVNAMQPTTPAALADSAKRTKLFWAWFKDNHTYASGTFQIHLRPDIRAGNGLLVRQGATDTYKEYLIEQVAHQYVMWPQPSFVTTLHVTRGQDRKGGSNA